MRDEQPAATIVVAAAPLWKNVKPEDDLAKDGRIYPRVFAEELQFWIEKASGAKLPIVAEGEAPAEGTLILFGESGLTKQQGFDCRAMPPEGVRIAAFERGLAILGDVFPALERGGYFCNRMDRNYPEPAPVEGDLIDRGIGHATYLFLERYAGYRFYHGGARDDPEALEFGTVIPKLKDLRIPKSLDFRTHPDFTHRLGLGRAEEADRYAWYRCFRTGGTADVHANHTHTSWHNNYGEKYPEIFARQQDGTPYFKSPTAKFIERSALNYAHPKVLELELEHIEHYDKTHTLATGWRAYATPNRLVAAPADGKWYDFSPEAKAWSDPDADLFETQTDLFWQYIAKLANVAKERWPQRRVIGSAYNRRLCPPSDRVKLPDNVGIELALCRSSAMTTLEANRVWLDGVIDRWYELLGKDRNNLGTWDYFCWPHSFYTAPVLHPHALQSFLQRNREKIAGSFVNPGGPMRMNHMMTSLWHRLLWDADLDVDAQISEYCRLFYGPDAGPHLEAAFKLAVERYERTAWTDKLALSSIPPHAFFEQIYPPDVVARMEVEFLAAYQALGEKPQNALYRKRLDYIYEDSGKSYFAVDGWAAFFRVSKLWHATKEAPVFAAPKVEDEANWAQATEGVLRDGTHLIDSRPAPESRRASARFARSGQALVVRLEAKLDPAALENVERDDFVLAFYELPAVEAQADQDVDEHEFFMRAASQGEPAKVFSVSVGRDGKASPSGVSARRFDVRDGWGAELTIPFAVLGFAEAAPPELRFNLRRVTTLKAFRFEDQKRKRGKKIPEVEVQSLCLHAYFPWVPFPYKERAARLKLE
ncbi:MAG: DUF4838 domain-containing protein [Planctomycetota bacterium]|nr:DUF4838 domain-containing protein [Planctomycetota bacterium]